MKLICLTGPAHSVFVKWDLILHRLGNVTLGQLTNMSVMETSTPLGLRDYQDYGGNKNENRSTV